MQVIQAIKEVIGRLPIPFTDDKRPKEKELDGSARQKVKHGQRKMLTVRSPAHALPPAPSASKQSDSRKGDNSLRSTRSQQVCKPSKKLCGSDLE